MSRIAWILLAAGITLSATTSYSQTIETSGSLSRSYEQSRSFTLNIAVKNLSLAQYTAVSANYAAPVRIYLTTLFQNIAVPRDLETDTNDVGFNFSEISSSSEAAADGERYNITLTIGVYETNRTIKSILNTAGKLPLTVDYAVTPVLEGKPIEIEVSVAVANQAPQFLSTTGRHKGLEVLFQQDASISYLNRPGGNTAAPEGARVFLLERAQDGVNIPTFTYNSDPNGTDTAGESCYFDASLIGSVQSCIVCPEEGHFYVDLSKFPNVGKVQAAQNGSARFSELDIDIDYVAFATYLPDGVAFSSCVSGRASVNLSWGELNGEPDAVATDKACFIATSAFSDVDHPHVEALRQLRDRGLERFATGRWFVDQYYTYSPEMAAWLDERPWLKPAVRLLLTPAVTLGHFLGDI